MEKVERKGGFNTATVKLAKPDTSDGYGTTAYKEPHVVLTADEARSVLRVIEHLRRRADVAEETIRNRAMLPPDRRGA